MFTEVDSFYSFPLTGIIPLEFKLLKSSSLGYLKGSPPPPAEKGGLRLAQGWVGTHTSLNCEGASSQLRSGLSLPPAVETHTQLCTGIPKSMYRNPQLQWCTPTWGVRIHARSTHV